MESVLTKAMSIIALTCFLVAGSAAVRATSERIRQAAENMGRSNSLNIPFLMR